MSKWIPCTEQLPTECDRYLVTCRYHVHDAIKNVYHIVTDVDIRWFDNDEWDDETVIAWMPLPDAFEPYAVGVRPF